jgi:hypothetical protein
MTCRACGSAAGDLVLDLGEQPACDHFPLPGDEGPDPLYPLQMWLCASCGLAQLVSDPTVAEEPLGQEPAALVLQAAEAVSRVAEGGWLPEGARVAECASPHGGSWLGLLSDRGLEPVTSCQTADVVVDCFGLMHEADQSRAIQSRAARVAAGGVLLLQFHSLATILRLGQWNSLRHGHYAYYSTAALSNLLASAGLSVRDAWRFELYGGTVLVAATRDRDRAQPARRSVATLLAEEAAAGVSDPAALRALEADATGQAASLYRWLSAERDAGRTVVGYGAASRAVALLLKAGVDSSLLPAVVDASAAKQGRRMPGTDIAVVSPGGLITSPPDSVLLFLPDLLAEVRCSFPEVERSGSRWVNVEALP